MKLLNVCDAGGFRAPHPVSTVLMSEYAGRTDRGRQVGLVFCAQAVGPGVRKANPTIWNTVSAGVT